MNGKNKIVENKKLRFYHCSPFRLPVGTIINGHSTDSGLRRPKCSSRLHSAVVFLTNSPRPHYTILTQAKEEKWFIYEVEPIGKIDISDDWDEYVAPCAKIIKFIRRVKPTDVGSFVPKRAYVQSKDDYSDTQEINLGGGVFETIKQKTIRR